MERPEIFISYAREDRVMAKAFNDVLSSEGLNVWWDDELYIGQKFDYVIERNITLCNALFCLWSPHSVSSAWVQREARLAIHQRKFFPIVLQECIIPGEFSAYHTIYHESWPSTINALQRSTLFKGVFQTQSKVCHKLIEQRYHNLGDIREKLEAMDVDELNIFVKFIKENRDQLSLIIMEMAKTIIKERSVKLISPQKKP
jgi:hypothetical protein